MPNLLQTVIADLRKQAGNSPVDEFAEMVRRGEFELIEVAPGEYGLCSTELAVAMLDARTASNSRSRRRSRASGVRTRLRVD